MLPRSPGARPRRRHHASEQAAQARAILSRLEDIDGSALKHQDELSLEILRWDLERFAEWNDLYHRLPRLTPYMFSGNGIHGVFQQLKVETPEDAERYLELVATYPGVARDLLGIAQRQVETGWAVAQPAIDQLGERLMAYIDRLKPHVGELFDLAFLGF